MIAWICSADKQEFQKKIIDWENKNSDDFSIYFLAIMLNNLLNFLMTLFEIFMLEKMSRAQWTNKLKDSKEAK